MNNLSLAALHTRNYKNLRFSTESKLLNLNVLIGPNGSGKSNYIDALKFLKECMVSNGDESRSTSQFEAAVSALGGYRVLDKSLKFPGKVNFVYEFNPAPDLEKGLKLGLELFVGAKDSRVSIAEDWLSDTTGAGETPFYYYKFHDIRPGTGAVSVWNDLSRSSSHFEKVDNVPTNSLGLAIVHELLEKSENPPQNTPVYKVRRALLEYIKRWHFYNSNYMNLEIIKRSEPKIGSSDIYLASSGANLAIVIENLIQQDIDFEDSLNMAMKAILPQTRRIRPVRTGLMTVNLEWHFEGLSDCFYLNELSDGTIRMLCWASILLSPVPPALLVIDEPEVGIHTAWLPILAEWIKLAAERTQVIVTTHSPDLLDNFTGCLENVSGFASEQDRNHFTIRPLSSEKMQAKLDEGWKLGDLYRVGDPAVGAWPW